MSFSRRALAAASIICASWTTASAQEVGPFRRGDVNADGAVDLPDAIFTLVYLFQGGPAPTCLAAADTNRTGGVDIADAVLLLEFLFVGGTPPEGVFACGTSDESTDVDVGCATPFGADLCDDLFVPQAGDGRVRLSFIAPAVVTGAPGGAASADVRVSLDSDVGGAEEDAVDGWSLSILARGACRIESATIVDTAGEPALAGGFHKTELVGDAPHDGAVSTVILSFTAPTVLPRGRSDLLALAVRAPVDDGCANGRLEFHDGLQASGQPIVNRISAGGRRLRPLSTPIDMSFCPTVDELVPDAPISVELTAASPRRFFYVAPGAGRRLLELTTGAGDAALFVRRERLPTPTDFDFASGGADPRTRLAFDAVGDPGDIDARWYVLVSRRRFDGQSVDATIEALTGDLVLERVSGCGDGCSGVVHLSVRGAGFDASTVFGLASGSRIRVSDDSPRIVDSRRAEIVFDLGSLAPGRYSVVALESGDNAPPGPAAVLSRAVRVLRPEEPAPDLRAVLAAPPGFRRGQIGRLVLEYENAGDEEIAAPIFEVRGPDGVDIGLDPIAGLSDEPVQILALPAGGVPGWLPPGATGRVPVYFRAPLFDGAGEDPGEDLVFELHRFVPDDAPPLDWTDVAPVGGVSTEAWLAARAGLERELGDDWTRYVEGLGSVQRTMLHRGRRIVSAGALFAEAFRRASGAASAFARGRAIDDDGVPHASIRVTAWSAMTGTTGTTRTAPDGSFAVGPLPAGVYSLHAEGLTRAVEGVIVDLDDVEGIELRGERGDDRFDFASISGRVLGRLGIPIVDVRVAAIDADERVVACSRTDRLGASFRIGPLPNGEYRIAVEGHDVRDDIDGNGVALLHDGRDAARLIVRVEDAPAATIECPTTEPQEVPAAPLPLPITRRIADVAVRVAEAVDPNEKVGPQNGRLTGAGPLRLRYAIHFENDEEAEAAALEVVIDDELDPHLDPRTLRFEAAWIDGAAPIEFSPVGGTPSSNGLTWSRGTELYRVEGSTESVVRFPEEMGPLVLTTFVEGRVDVDGDGRATAAVTFRGEDPVTKTLLQLRPDDLGDEDIEATYGYLSNAGMLAPGASGWVAFSVEVRSDTPHGIIIPNKGRVWFDDVPCPVQGNPCPDGDGTVPCCTNTVETEILTDLLAVRGDANDDGRRDVSDARFLLDYLFLGGRSPSCLAAGDTNGDEELDIGDAIYHLNWLFLGGREPFPVGVFACDVAD